MTIEEIKKYLDHGDYVKIARMAGYKNLANGRGYVYKVMSGVRNSNKGISKKILEAAQIIAEQNFISAKANDPEQL